MIDETHKSFTEIGQYRQVVREVKSHHDYSGRDQNGDAIYSHTSPYPTLRFRGTVKLHGTNSAVVKYGDGHYEFQSRERVLSLEEDNSGFMRNMMTKDYQSLFNGIEFNDYCAIYGEWCGQGIMKGVAISGLPKMFVIFGVKIDDNYKDIMDFFEVKNHEQGIYNILDFPNYSMTIDFNHPEIIQNTLVEFTENVEKECPVGKTLGVEGTGEGIVWECFNNGHRYIFKVKGEKHQNSKVKTLATVDTEAIANINSFIDYAVTENRLMQGVEKMKEMGLPIEPKTTGDYLRWVYNDVIKEESDTMAANGIDPKKIGSAISAKARMFWLNYLNSNF